MRLDTLLRPALASLAVTLAATLFAAEPPRPGLSVSRTNATRNVVKWSPYPAADTYTILHTTNLSVPFTVIGTDREYLLFDWLRGLLLYADENRVLFSRFDVSVTDTGLSATAHGEPLDPARHQLAREVKAITYHELKVEQTPAGWLAEVIVDI